MMPEIKEQIPAAEPEPETSMELLIVFLIFLAGMAVCLSSGITMLLPLCLGLALFTLLAVRKGFSVGKVMGFAKESLKDSFIVIRILLLIGCLTGTWRLSGTVAYFVTLGVSSIPPRLFILAAFLLAAAMSYALGTSFGVSATAGVILMSIARAGGVDPVLAAGAVLSGVYVGDRGSPAASSGNLVAVLTHTDMRKNVRLMLKDSLLPFFLCCLLYGLLSARAPMQRIDSDILRMLGEEFSLHWSCLIPALLMIVLPFCSVSIRWSMAVSLLSAAAVALFVQHASVPDCLRAMLLGYGAKNASLSGMLSGGGILSMMDVTGILLVSCSYGNIFEGTGLLDSVNKAVSGLGKKLGRFPVMILLGVGVAAVFCNQTIGAIMQSNLSASLYGGSEEERSAKMLAMEDTVIVLSGMIPWCLACSVPLSMLNADVRSVPLSFYLWLVPLWHLLREALGKKHTQKAA